LLLGSSCIEEFQPVIPGADNLIVVEGNILEGTAGAKIALSRSFDFGQNQPTRITDAEVVIRDDQGNSSTLNMTDPGIYESDTTELIGIPGRSYQLYVNIPPAIELESEWELLRPSADLESVRTEWKQVDDEIGPTEGLQIYLDANAENGGASHFRWEYEETWIFRVPYPATGVWNTQTNIPELYPNSFRPQTCWTTQKSTEVFIGSTEGLIGQRIADVPMRFISIRGNELRLRYSILVKQYSIGPDTHEFWRRLKNVTEDLGTLFDPIPTEIEGNIKNLNRDIEVLGYFSADGYEEKRIFIDRADLPMVPIRTGFETCNLDTVDRFDVNSEIIVGNVYVADIYGPFGGLIGFGVTQARCADCRLSGSIERPDFWD
ncbi:MAG: DUF4249 domain-containing protein, partial [Bacteroidota bacterium]